MIHGRHTAIIKVTVQVITDDPNDPSSEDDLERTAVEAIRNALEVGEDTGFEHGLAHRVSVGIVAVEGNN